MRMADGGYRPAFNMQFAVDADRRAILGVGVPNSGSDAGKITPMVEEVERRTGKCAKQWLVASTSKWSRLPDPRALPATPRTASPGPATRGRARQ